ncbi:LysM peptidoglycan-binding domain-containing protein [Georgenia sp. Z1491]|uniref:LysM peptidoglycan-binding domain-containing protein n=1 Tax=Georgenia sp. Z1491 TaxID=3416707 RepID=UPI003CF60B2C
MSALPLETGPVLPRRTRPRLQLVGPGFVPQPPLRDEAPDRAATAVLVPGPAAAPSARPAALPVAPSRPLARPSVAAPAVRGDSPAARPAPLRLTARGVMALRALVLGAALLVVVGLGAGVGALASPGVEASDATVVVAPGESLWSVASGVAGPGEDVRDVVAQIAELNGLSGQSVSVGEVLRLPR